MFTYLEKLRQKSPAVKKLIAFCVSFAIAGIIFIFWIIVTVPSVWSDKSISDRVSDSQPSPLSSISEIFSQGSRVLGDQIKSLASTTEISTGTSAIPDLPTEGTTTPEIVEVQ